VGSSSSLAALRSHQAADEYLLVKIMPPLWLTSGDSPSTSFAPLLGPPAPVALGKVGETPVFARCRPLKQRPKRYLTSFCIGLSTRGPGAWAVSPRGGLGLGSKVQHGQCSNNAPHLSAEPVYAKGE
jgi:hypothetical protein